MEEFKELARKSIILFMKVNLKMTFIMDMADTSMQMVAITSEIGLMEKDLDGVNMLTSLERFKKECGNTQNLLVTAPCLSAVEDIKKKKKKKKPSFSHAKIHNAFRLYQQNL